jgi:cytochrome c
MLKRAPIDFTRVSDTRRKEHTMMKPTFQGARIMVASAAVLASGNVYAQVPEPTALIDQQHCMFCHTVDAPFLAPSFHQIADRYRDKPHAVDMLEQKLRLGGKAHWGDTAMPLPADRGGPLSPEDARTLVEWVLTQ